MAVVLAFIKRISIFLNKMQVRKRERMAKIREEIAVQKAKETELNKTIHITGSITQSNLIYQIYFNLFLQ